MIPDTAENADADRTGDVDHSLDADGWRLGAVTDAFGAISAGVDDIEEELNEDWFNYGPIGFDDNLAGNWYNFPGPAHGPFGTFNGGSEGHNHGSVANNEAFNLPGGVAAPLINPYPVIHGFVDFFEVTHFLL